jgi:serine/threonine protein kinase
MSDTNSMIGRTLGQYKIVKFIANGGMADVYHAHDEGLDRDVALKILFPQYSRDEEFTIRFQREARAAASLRHPNIVQIYATGVTDEGDHYIAMEFVPDGTLEEINSSLGKEGELVEVGLVLKMMQQIADALREAHDTGIVHRDLKPSNILLRSNNSPVLTDLGIALSGNAPRLTQTNKMMGTPDYMSPEQAQGLDLDGRSDIYSFGIMLYELLCGRRPFGNESPWMIIHKQINEEPKPLDIVRAGLDPHIYEIVSRCMAKNPDLRYQTAADLTQALNEAIVSSGDGSDQSGTWKTVTLGSAGVRPPTGGTLQQQAAGSSGFSFAAQSGPQSGPHSNPNLKPASSGFSWGIWIAIVLVIMAIGGLAGWLIWSIAPDNQGTATAVAGASTVLTVSAEAVEPTLPPTPLPTATEIAVEALATTQVITQVIVVASETPKPPTVTPEPTTPATATNTPEATVVAIGDGLPIRFENDDGWRIEGDANGSLILASDPVFAGDFSGRIDYEFNTAESDSLRLVQTNSISGRPDTIGVRLYGDGSAHLVYALILDADQQSWLIPLGPINHTDRWAFMSGSLEAGNRIRVDESGDNTLDFPIEFHGFQITDKTDSFQGSGTIYIDELSAFAPETTESTTPATSTQTEETSTATPASGRNVTITIAPGGRCDDGPHDLPHNRTLAFKWTSNLSPADLLPGDRFVFTISGGGQASGLSFDQSLSSTPGEWLISIQPENFNISNNTEYDWSVQLYDIDDQIIARSGQGCFNT